MTALERFGGASKSQTKPTAAIPTAAIFFGFQPVGLAQLSLRVAQQKLDHSKKL
jgi:hypothetical protein